MHRLRVDHYAAFPALTQSMSRKTSLREAKGRGSRGSSTPLEQKLTVVPIHWNFYNYFKKNIAKIQESKICFPFKKNKRKNFTLPKPRLPNKFLRLTPFGQSLMSPGPLLLREKWSVGSFHGLEGFLRWYVSKGLSCGWLLWSWGFGWHFAWFGVGFFCCLSCGFVSPPLWPLLYLAAVWKVWLLGLGVESTCCFKGFLIGVNFEAQKCDILWRKWLKTKGWCGFLWGMKTTTLRIGPSWRRFGCWSLTQSHVASKRNSSYLSPLAFDKPLVLFIFKKQTEITPA